MISLISEWSVLIPEKDSRSEARGKIPRGRNHRNPERSSTASHWMPLCLLRCLSLALRVCSNQCQYRLLARIPRTPSVACHVDLTS